MKSLIIITDLDGTLLNGTYSFDAAEKSIQLLKRHNIPLIICSSKTRKEIEHYRRLLSNRDPFISENGGGIFIPQEQKNFLFHERPGMELQSIGSYSTITLGASYIELKKGIEALRSAGFPVKGFGDMDSKEVAALTGLPPEEAVMSKERDFDEPFLFSGQESDVPALVQEVRKLGFRLTRGRFYHLLGNSDKGKAISLLLDLYRKAFGDIFSVALGDGPNDLPMLERVDLPVIIRKEDGTYDPALHIEGAVRTKGPGPAGWNESVLEIVGRFVG